MTLQQEKTSQFKNGYLTIEDVESVLMKWRLDPFQTNANTIRDITKRGSMIGIQKCLNAIRSESK